VVDEPCASSNAVSRCTAHVFLANHGGDGFGHATIVVPMSSLSAASATRTAPATCGTPIPETPAGGFADLTCSFDLPPGTTTAGTPHLRAVDFAFAMTFSSSGDQTSGIATLVLAAIAGLLAVVMLAGPIFGRRIVAGTPSNQAAPEPDGDDEKDW
jgi:hypothetical protein